MISLKDYIKKQNGVPFGHSNSLKNMLKRSFGAKSFNLFWVHWNPIWNYYLNKYIHKSVKRITNDYLSIILTFCFSGLIHDLVGLLIYKRMLFLFSIWFLIMGIIVVIFKKNKLVYKTQTHIFKKARHFLTQFQAMPIGKQAKQFQKLQQQRANLETLQSRSKIAWHER